MKPCPQCQESNLKKAALVFLEGSRNSVGVGVSTAGVGVGAGQSISKLAALCAPPRVADRFMEDSGNWIMLIFFLPLLPSMALPDGIPTFIYVWAGLGVAVMCGKFYKYQKRLAERQNKLNEDYDKKFICLTCGVFSTPLD